MKIAAFIAVAGLASVAAAQSATINLTHDDADGVIGIGESVTWTLSVAFEGAPAGSVAGGGNMALSGNAVGDAGDMNYTPSNGNNAGGTASGANIDIINWTNSLFIELGTGGANPANRDNPYTVGTFSFTGTADGSVEYGLGTGPAASAFLTIETGPLSSVTFAEGEVQVNVDALRVIPTPASAALLGLGGLVVTRRRR